MVSWGHSGSQKVSLLPPPAVFALASSSPACEQKRSAVQTHAKWPLRRFSFHVLQSFKLFWAGCIKIYEQALQLRTSVGCSRTTQESLQCAVFGCFGYKNTQQVQKILTCISWQLKLAGPVDSWAFKYETLHIVTNSQMRASSPVRLMKMQFEGPVYKIWLHLLVVYW